MDIGIAQHVYKLQHRRAVGTTEVNVLGRVITAYHIQIEHDPLPVLRGCADPEDHDLSLKIRDMTVSYFC